jgi:acetolactate synthase small subunit
MDKNVEQYIKKLKKTIPKIKITDDKSETKLTSHELDQMF